MDAINGVASYLRVNPKVFAYAGSKDKRGKTSQLVSAYQISPERLLKINNDFNTIRVGNIVFKNEQLKLGDLRGNRFIIILRQLQGDPTIIEKAIDSLSSKGFINYYGLQRFGTSSVSTHSIGRLVLRSQWKEAINLILTPRNEGDDELNEAKRIWAKTEDANLALKNLRRKSSIEGKLLCGLASSHKRDFCNAFGAIPRNMRLMYLHSYQSYIWNKVASKRIKEYGLKVLKGDLVPCEAGAKGWYSEFLKEDGMEWSDFDSKVKANSLSGAYRKLIVVPEDVKWEIIPYSDVTKSLVLSDLDRLQGLPEPTVDEAGSLKALKLEFQLPPSAYATMAIREISKQSTSYVSPSDK
ncbi:unnamed protein product [Larinioides sclopetarius]|uniref:TRUD domain-containing protein n=1 Tax=Larinioides sclopetarius TaxID=280406 RepID=A0AAV2B0S8_9ARAC